MQTRPQPQAPKPRSWLAFWVAVVLVGPFALPLLWRDERYSRGLKWVISIAVVVLTVVLLWGTVKTAIKGAEMIVPQLDPP